MANQPNVFTSATWQEFRKAAIEQDARMVFVSEALADSAENDGIILSDRSTEENMPVRTLLFLSGKSAIALRDDRIVAAYDGGHELHLY